jgi:hypothetical protein
MDIHTAMYMTGVEYSELVSYYSSPMVEHEQRHSQILNTCIDEKMLNFIEEAYYRNIFTTLSCEGYRDCETTRFEYPNFAYRASDDDKVKEWFNSAGVETEDIIFKKAHFSNRYNEECKQIFITNEVKEKLLSCC